MRRSGAALVLLHGPDSGTERLTRRLRLAWGEWGDAVGLQRRLAPEQKDLPANAFRGRIKSVAQELHLDMSVVCGRWSWASVVREAASSGQIATPMSAEFSWRVCSGFAHAREWPRLLMLDVTTSDPDADGRVDMDLSTDRGRLFNVLFVAFDLATEARRQIDRRRLSWKESRPR